MTVRPPVTVLLVCLVALAGLSFTVVVQATSSDEPDYVGMKLSDVLGDLRSRGLKIVFTSQAVSPDMVVAARPVSTESRAILDEILEPHGLMARDGPRDSLVVVRRPPSSMPPSGSAAGAVRSPGQPTPGAGVFIEEPIVITPSRVSMLREEPGATVGFSREQIQQLPHLGDDFFRAVSLAPGVSGNDVSAQFNVRGGRSDETQVLLDGQELYDPYHLKEFDSALSFVASSTLSRADLTTGGFAAEYGDRMSGVLDMTTVTPTGPPKGRVGISVLNLHAGGDGGFNDGAGSWLFEVRRGTIDLASQLLGNENPEYGDAYAKLEYQLDPRNSLRFTMLYSMDKYRFAEVVGAESKSTDTRYHSAYFWLTHRVTLGRRLFVETAASRVGLDQERTGVAVEEDVQFDLRDNRNTELLGLRQTWNLRATPKHFLKWGAELRAFDTEYDYFGTLVFDNPLAGLRDDPKNGITEFAGEFEEQHTGVFVSDNIRLAEPLTVELGLRYDRHSLTDENFTSPRFNLAWAPGDAGVVRVAWGRYLQSQRPYELQIEDGDSLFRPTERSEHRVVGYERTLARDSKTGGLALRVELYQRRVSNPRPRYENLFEGLNTFPEIEPDRVRIAADKSVAEGVELFLQGQAGERVTWWANYAYATTEDEISGDDVPRKIDQRHTLNLVLNSQVGRHWNLNFAWRFHSGWPTTSISLEQQPGRGGETIFVPVLGPLFGERLPPYHRLDLRAGRQFNLRRGRLLFFVDVQNVYNRDNIAGFDIQIDEELGTLSTETEYWAGILPSVGITWEF